MKDSTSTEKAQLRERLEVTMHALRELSLSAHSLAEYRSGLLRIFKPMSAEDIEKHGRHLTVVAARALGVSQAEIERCNDSGLAQLVHERLKEGAHEATEVG